MQIHFKINIVLYFLFYPFNTKFVLEFTIIEPISDYLFIWNCTACGVDFENQNYTILTSQCKGPQYPPKVCCEAFKEFACPFSDEINDMTTDCATVMFSYINIYGKYPPGLFANECKEGKEGLDCSQVKSTNSSNNPSTSFHVDAPHSMFIISIVAFFGFIFHLF